MRVLTRRVVSNALSALLLIGLVSVSQGQTAPGTTAAQPARTQIPPATGTPSSNKKVWKPGDNCVTDDDDVRVELESGRHPVGGQILTDTYFLAASTTVEVVLSEPFDAATRYFAYIQQDKAHRSFMGRSRVSSSRVSESNSLVKKGIADKSDTLITLRVPDNVGGLWRRTDLYIYSCLPPGSPKSVSHLVARISSPFYSGFIVWSALIFIYGLAALASKAADIKDIRWYRYFDPVFMTAGSDGKGSLSKLQILFFSLIVFGLLSYIVLRTGILSDISPTILLLLGIAGVGSAAAKGADLQKNRLDPENWAWFVRKGWLPPGGLAEVNKARWRDIFTSDGEFDVYRYQSFIFSLIVGAALLAAGISELASFTIPETLLGILGLSQVIYIGGKLVSPSSVADLNAATTELRALEKKVAEAASAAADPDAGADGQPSAVAMRRAGTADYMNYIDKAKNVRILFSAVTGRDVANAAIEPSVAS